MPECDRCGEHVTDAFHRVFSSNDGYLDGCPECRPQTDILNGETATP